MSERRGAPQIYSDQDIISAVQEFDTADGYQLRTGISMMTVKRRFGGWNKLREVAGFKVHKQGRPFRMEEYDMLVRYMPGDTLHGYCKRNKVATKTVYNRFGSWTGLVEQAVKQQQGEQQEGV